jgi:hypothetical protein
MMDSIIAKITADIAMSDLLQFRHKLRHANRISIIEIQNSEFMIHNSSLTLP